MALFFIKTTKSVCVCVLVYRQILKVIGLHITECGVVTATFRALAHLLRSRKLLLVAVALMSQHKPDQSYSLL